MAYLLINVGLFFPLFLGVCLTNLLFYGPLFMIFFLSVLKQYNYLSSWAIEIYHV